MPRGKPGVVVSYRIDPDIAGAMDRVKEKRAMDRAQMICQGVLMAFRDDFIAIVGVEQYTVWLSAATSGMEND